jgi:OHCU decarboxylase
MAGRRPFESVDTLLAAADDVWRTTTPPDWDEAFSHHPRIGERSAGAAVSPRAAAWSAGEQRAAAGSDADARAALAAATEEYERRFGRIYIVCASGRTAEELLADVRSRLGNDGRHERAIAMMEQAKITQLRLRKLVGAEER